MTCSESVGGGISDAPTAVLGESEESCAAAPGLCAVNFWPDIKSYFIPVPELLKNLHPQL